MASRQPNSEIYKTLRRLESVKPTLFASLRKACLDDKCQARGNGRFVRLSKKFPKLLDQLQVLCPSTPVSIIERTIRFMRENKCDVCGKPCLWFTEGPLKFCSNECCKVGHTESGFYKEQASKRLAYFQENYGVKCSMQLPEVKNKIIKTMRRRCGVDHALQNKNVLEKFKRTNNIRYGGNSPSCSLEVQQRQIAALESRYGKGVVNPSCIPGMTAKKIENSMRRHGVKHACLLREVQARREASMLERTGYAHQMHNPEIAKKVTHSQRNAKEWTDQFGNVHECRGCEPQVLSALEDAGAIVVSTDFGDMPEVFYINPLKGKQSLYQPDAFIVWGGEGYMVEAKQYDGLFFRENEYKRNKPKFDAANKVCRANGIRFMLAIHDKETVRVVKSPTYKKLETILHQKFPERFDETV